MRMSKRLQSKRVRCALVLFVLFAVQMVMHLNVDNILLDDWVFFSVLDGGQNILDFLAARWQTWSSRLLIEGVLALITHSIWAFRFLDSAVMVLMAWSLARLANSEDRPLMLALASCLVTAIPFAVLRSTGWMATSLNYYWPLAATLTALIPLADALWERRTGRGLMIAAVLCAVFGANQEQTSAVIMGSYLVLGAAVMLRDRRVTPHLIVIFAIGAIELVLHLICPGNGMRAQDSIALVNLRDYGQFSFIDKLSIGLTSTTALMIYTYNPILLACGAVTCSTLTARRRGVLAHVLAGLTALFVLRAFMAYFTYYSSGLAGANAPFTAMYSYSLILGPEGLAKGFMPMAMMFVTVAVLGFMALTLYRSIGHRPLAAVSVFAFAIGFAARMALSFSPTVVESGERTMLPLYGAMMLCSLLCLRDCKAEGGRKWPVFAAFLIAAAVAWLNIQSSFTLAA